jgi:hypothetical protein
MSTSPIPARLIPQSCPPLSSFARIVSLAETALDVLGEAEFLANLARARYPSAD